jgi:hypothetical protein
MKVAVIALILIVLAEVVLLFGDTIYSAGVNGLFSNGTALLLLLLIIPLSLSQFFSFHSVNKKKQCRTGRKMIPRSEARSRGCFSYALECQYTESKGAIMVFPI